MIKSLDEQQYSTATIGAPLISSAKLQFFRDNAKHSNGYFGTSMGMLEKSRREKNIFQARFFIFSPVFYPKVAAFFWGDLPKGKLLPLVSIGNSQKNLPHLSPTLIAKELMRKGDGWGRIWIACSLLALCVLIQLELSARGGW